MTDGTPFQVTEGPQCAEGFTWWKIHATNGDGWLAEGNAAGYFVDPVTITGTPPSAATFSCTGALPTRLAVGAAGVARIVGTSNALNVRADAGKAAKQVGSLSAGRQFTVADGPKCADGSVWWKVQSSVVSGWIAEDDGTSYFVDPVGVPIPSQTPSPTPSPTPTVPPSPTPRVNIILAANKPTMTISYPLNFVVWSPKGDALLVSGGRGFSGIFSLNGTQLVDLSNSKCGLIFIGWTADGNLHCVENEVDESVYDLHDKKIASLTSSPSKPFQQAGTIVSFIGKDGALKSKFDSGGIVLSYSADGSVLAVNIDKNLLLYAPDGKVLATIPLVDNSAVYSFFVSPDGKRIAVTTQGQNVAIYDNTGIFEGNISIDDGRSVMNVAWAPDSNTLAVDVETLVWIVPLPN